MRSILLLPVLLLAACAEVATAPPPGGQVPVTPSSRGPDQVTRASAPADFAAVVRRVEPVAERICRSRAPRGTNCDFLIVVDPNPRAQPNAFQTLDARGRPVVGFTRSLIVEARNRDEIAFVLGHEAAHHIEGHIARQRQSAVAGQMLAGVLAELGGGDDVAIQRASEIGAVVGSRRYSKEFELEADRLGTLITARAGYDPLRGSEFFDRLPDPGDRFLGSHPPNSQRRAAVAAAAARL